MNKQEAQKAFEAGQSVNVTFKATTRAHRRKATRRLTGFNYHGRTKCTYHGDTSFILEDYEIIGFELAPVPLKNMTIVCRRWFEMTNGNTYHSVIIQDIMDKPGKVIAHEPFEYGYDRQCIQTAADMLTKLGYKVSYHDLESKVAYVQIYDVSRKKDL